MGSENFTNNDSFSLCDHLVSNYTVKYPSLVHFSEEYSHFHGYVALAICLFGVPANFANIIVLTRKNMFSATNLILTGLAFADLLTMASQIPVCIHFYMMKEPYLSFPSTLSYPWIIYMMFFINFVVIMHTIAIWLTITLAVFRFIFIYYPSRGPYLCSVYRSKMSMIIVYIVCTFICIPNCLSTIPLECELDIEDKNISKKVTYHTVFDSQASYAQIMVPLNYWIQAIMIKLVPCFLLTLLTILLITAMHQANKKRQQLMKNGRKTESDRAREHNRTTGMLLAIVIIFVLTELPQGILTLLNFFVDGFANDVYWPLGDLLDCFALINNAINFVLFCSMSRQFRETFKEVFCQCCPESRPGWMKLSTFVVHTHSTQGDGTELTNDERQT